MQFQSSGVVLKSQNREGSIVAYGVEGSELLDFVMKRLGVMPPAMRHLGEGLLGAVLMQALFEKMPSPKVELQWSLNGPFGNLFVDAFGEGRVRGVIQNPQVYVDSMAVGLGEGVFSLRRIHPDQEAISGTVVSSGSVAADLEHYLLQSEQKKAILYFDVQLKWDEHGAAALPQTQSEKSPGTHPFEVAKAFAWLIHFVPPSGQSVAVVSDEEIAKWREDLKNLEGVAQWILDGVSDGANPEDANFGSGHAMRPISGQSMRPISGRQFLEMWIHQMDESIVSTGSGPLSYYCPCDQERATRALALLTKREREHLVKPEDEHIEIRCEYCSELYRIQIGS